MQYTPIGPLSLKHLFEHAPRHMALAQYLYDPDYFQFYREQVLAGKFVILDSGVYEGSAVSERELLHWCMNLKPSAVILPDVPHQMKATLEKSLHFADLLDHRGVKVRKWKVLHAPFGVFEDFVISYLYDSRLFDGICFSRLTGAYQRDNVVMKRPEFIKELIDLGFWRKGPDYHALGMADGSVEEFQRLSKLGVIHSCDSSAPIWRGVHSTLLPNKPAAFDHTFDPWWLPPADFNPRYIARNLSFVGFNQMDVAVQETI